MSAVVASPNSTPVAKQESFALTVTSAGGVIVGFVVSITVTVWVAVAILPLESVTVQVTVVFPNSYWSGASFVTVDTLQLSAVVVSPNSTPVAKQESFALTVTSAGGVIVGFVVSIQFSSSSQLPKQCDSVESPVTSDNILSL